MHGAGAMRGHTMRWPGRRRRLWSGAASGAAALALAAAAAGLAGVASSSSAALVHADFIHGEQPVGAVSPHPAAGTPELPRGTSRASDEIKHMVQCGGTMYAVGEFTQVISHGTTLTRDNVFSFSATTPFTVKSWAPEVNGTVNSIALTSNCGQAFIGGSFTKVDGTTADNIADIRTSNGTLVSTWGHDANRQVQTLALTSNGHLLAGGQFTSINGSGADPYFASLNPSNGADDGFLRLHISGHYHYCRTTSKGRCSITFPTQVANQQLSHSGTLDLAEGVFTSVGGQDRQQIFMLNLATSPASVTAWTSPEFDGSKGNVPGGYPYECYWDESYYLRDAAWSPNDSTIYTAETGYHPWNLSVNLPRSGLCDAAVAWPATHGVVYHQWINYTGCNSLYSVAADNAAVYVAGHPQWSENANGCKVAGPGAVADKGMQGLAPTTGDVFLNSSGKAVYSMSRANAGDMLITGAGLWIGSTNRYGASWCNNLGSHTGICFLPYHS
jgi:hypothetical protein